MFFLSLMMVSLLAFNQNQVDGCTAGLFEYCNLNASLDNIIPCEPPLICNTAFRQCWKPDNGSCVTTWECSFVCYNGTCLSEQQYEQFACNDSSQCPSTNFCSAGKHCRLPPEAACNTTSICSNFTACINGTCSAPDLYDACSPTDQKYPCRRGQCHPAFGICLIPEGGACTKSIECGIATDLVCFQAKCQRPGLNQICQPTASNGVPATICREGVCSITTGYCVQSGGIMMKASTLLMIPLSIVYFLMTQ